MSIMEADMSVSRELLEVLACPACKGDVELKGDRIVCKKCGRRYPVRDGIPVMIIEEAEEPSDTSGDKA